MREPREGVSRSTDAGNSWTTLSGQNLNAVNAVAIDHKKSSTIYAGTGGILEHVLIPGRIHKSADGGQTMQAVYGDVGDAFVTKINLED